MAHVVYDIITAAAGNMDFFQDYINGRIDAAEYKAKIHQNRQKLYDAGLNDFLIGTLTRLPRNEMLSCDIMLDTLRKSGVPECRISRYHPRDFDDFHAMITQKYKHLPGRTTSIFPSEARCAYALGKIIEPKTVVVVGSYYNYLAVNLVPGLADGGVMICSDPDRGVSELAAENMENLGFSEKVICDNRGFEKIFEDNFNKSIDILVIDAYGYHTNPDRRYHGKAIYAPILERATSYMHSESYILVHNFETYSSDLDEFMEMTKNFSVRCHLQSSENLALLKR